MLFFNNTYLIWIGSILAYRGEILDLHLVTSFLLSNDHTVISSFPLSAGIQLKLSFSIVTGSILTKLDEIRATPCQPFTHHNSSFSAYRCISRSCCNWSFVGRIGGFGLETCQGMVGLHRPRLSDVMSRERAVHKGQARYLKDEFSL